MKWVEPRERTVPSAFSSAIGGNPIVARMLFQRGFEDVEQALSYLDPEQYSPTSPFELSGISQAVEIIFEGIQAHKQMCVWGDFDVDGQTSTTVLVSGLRHFGAQVQHYIPVRGKESHGLHPQKLADILDHGIQLLITCDTGISDTAAVDLARSRGVEVVITDHHELPNQLPAADAIVNPKMLPQEHPLYPLPGVGVAYMLMLAVADRAGETDFTTSLLDLVALGIVADVADLRGEARYLLQRGLPALRETHRLGLQMMMQLAELNPENLTEEHIGFVIGPRLNALGRLDDTNPIVDFLTTQDPLQARLFANQLEGLNARRQLLTDQVFQSALELIEREPRYLNYEVLVLAHPAWPGGVVGIVANRLAERFGRPVILLTTPDGQPARGSARSIDQIDITQAISQHADLLLSFGGHPMAAGMSLDQDKIDDFRRAISRSVAEQMASVSEPTLKIDAFVPLGKVDFDFVDAIERLAPFGKGNPAPLLAAKGVQIENKRVIGRREDHLILNLVDKQQNIHRALWWNGAGMPLPEGEFDLAYTARRSQYRGQPQLQIEWVDWHQAVTLEPVDLRVKPAMEVLDHRRESDPNTHLAAILEIETDIVVWREGVGMDKTPGVDRFGLRPGPALVIWSTPPSLELLDNALSIVQPERLFLFAQDPGFGSPTEFITGLAGLIKFALKHHDGKISVEQLAATTGHTQATVEAGLRWMASRGDITLETSEQDIWQVRAGGRPGKEVDSLARVMEDRLQETFAFRRHYLRVEHGFLLLT